MSKKKNKELTSSTKFIIALILFVFIVFCAYPLPSIIHARHLQNEYVEKYGKESITTQTGEGVAWTYVLMNHTEELFQGWVPGETQFNYDEVKISRGHHWAYGNSYNYMKYVFKYQDRKFTVIYKIKLNSKYEEIE